MSNNHILNLKIYICLQLVGDIMVDFSMVKLNEIHEAMAERDELLQQSHENICDARKRMGNIIVVHIIT